MKIKTQVLVCSRNIFRFLRNDYENVWGRDSFIWSAHGKYSGPWLFMYFLFTGLTKLELKIVQTRGAYVLNVYGLTPLSLFPKIQYESH